MSLLTLDLQIPKSESLNIPQLLNGSAGEVLSWNLLYSDPQSAYYRIELFQTKSSPDELETKILSGCPQARVKIKDESAAAADPLLQVTPARALDFRKAFHRTSPEFIESTAQTAIRERKDLRKLAMIRDRVLFLSDGAALSLRQRAAIALERDAYLACKFGDLQAVPMLLEARNDEEFLKSVLCLAQNAFVIRLSMLAKNQAVQLAERIAEQLPIPLLHAEYIETSAIIAAIAANAFSFHKVDLTGKTIAIIGLGPASLGLMQILKRMGASKLYGVDAEYSQATRFEREGGIATSIDFAIERSDALIVTPGTPVLLDGRKLTPGQIVLSFTPGTVEIGGLTPEATERIHFCQEPHPIYASPGILRGIHEFGIESVSIEMAFRAAQVLVERCGDNRFLPIPSESLIQAQADSLKGFGR
ncbi:MAG: hypothetical protein JNM27_16590 [Leptospirales bacterium]|nr:hypothetical protein [Leptospirales bacterium]